MDNEQKKKLKSSFEIIWHIASGTMNIISFIAAIVSAVKGNFDLAWQVVVTIIAVDSGLLVVFAIYATILWFKIKKIEKQDKDELNKNLENIKNERKEISEYKITTQDNIHFLENGIEISQSLNSECVIQINKSLSDMAKYIAKISNIAKSKDAYTRKNKQIEDSIEELETDIKKRYNAFFTYCTEKLKSTLDLSFNNRNFNFKNSIAIKQLKTALFWTSKASKEKAVSEAKIITTFRDAHTYTQYNREVGKKEYTIIGNTDFNHCLNKPHYRNNAIGENDNDTYQNENSNFLSFYNRTVVVPIFVSEASGKKYYGYLTADTLDLESATKEVYDMQMLNIMKCAASTIAMYFNVMEQHWGDALNTIKDIILYMKKPKNAATNSSNGIDLEIEFLNMVYNLKHKSYNSIDNEVVS